MRKIALTFITLTIALLTCSAQNSKQALAVLDKAAAKVGRAGGASATFKVTSSAYGNAYGSIAIKGNKFRATTPEATVWYNGKTQWSYMSSTNEVNVSTPTEAQQMSLNPYKFITIYRNGFDMTMTTSKSAYVVHLKAQNQRRTIKEMYITVNKTSYIPTQIKMRQAKGWSTITISNFKAKNLSDNLFVFNKKNYPNAEVIDLR